MQRYWNKHKKDRNLEFEIISIIIYKKYLKTSIKLILFESFVSAH